MIETIAVAADADVAVLPGELAEQVLPGAVRARGLRPRVTRLPPPRPASMRDTLALVLAGGRGSRLGGLTQQRAKPAVPIGGRYRIIDFVLSNCLNSRVPHVGVLTQYMAHSLTPHLDAWSLGSLRHGQSVRPLRACGESSYLGTADAVHQNRDIIRSLAPSYVLILAADHVYKMDYAQMLAEHQRAGADVTVGCVEVPLADASAFGVMQVDDRGRVTGFEEKPQAPTPIPGRPDTALASMGIYLFDPAFLLRALAADEERGGSSRDFGHDVLPRAVTEAHVHAHRLRHPASPHRPAYWRDVGTIDAYWRTNLEIAGHAPGLELHDAAWPIRASVAAPGRPSAPRRSAQPQAACAVVFPGAAIAPQAQLDEAVVLPGARVGQGCVVRRAIIEEGCRLPDGLRIGVDPEQDRQRFHVSEQGIVLVTPQMLAGA